MDVTVEGLRGDVLWCDGNDDNDIYYQEDNFLRKLYCQSNV
jgi:hypothetical protein